MTSNDILDLGQRWADAELRGDATALDALLADDFVGIGPFGFVLTRQQWLDRYRSGDLKNEEFAWQDVSVRDYGDTAVAVGIQAQRTSHRGNETAGRFRATQIAVRRDGRWQLAGVQLSGPIPANPPGRP
jgi:ketosteroid isomerase-like protein